MEAVKDAPPAGAAQDEQTGDPATNGKAPENIAIGGTVQLGLFKAGGKDPTSATVTFIGGRVDLEKGRAFQKGDVVRFEGTAVIVGVALRDKKDSKTQQVVACKQHHEASITDLQLA